MADALISPAVGGAMYALSGAALAYSYRKSRKEGLLSEKKIPVIGIMSAFVFAGQMVNFTIPGTGSSGHIGGGIMLAALLGGGPALLCITAVLMVQCLLFADGGLLALGCNIFNLGILPCLVAYPLIFRPILKRGINKKNIMLASVLAAAVGLQLGAFSVVLQTLLSGITSLPFSSFLLFMQPIHLVIGVVEGLVTAAVLAYVHSARPELMESAQTVGPLHKGLSPKKVLAVLGVITLLTAGGLSYLASANPDGLEWSVDRVQSISGASGAEGEVEQKGGALLNTDGEVYDTFAAIQQTTSVLPDYAFRDSNSAAGTSAAGMIGSAVTLLAAAGIGVLIAKTKRKAA